MDSKIKVVPLSLAHTAYETGFYSLGLVQVYAKSWKNNLLQEKFEFCKVGARGKESFAEIKALIKQERKPAIYLFSSFFWTHPINMEFARFIKQLNPQSLVIFGGPDVPRRKEAGLEFMKNYPEIDIAVMGEGELTFAEILETLYHKAVREKLTEVDFSSIQGLMCRKHGDEICWTGTREQIRELDTIPSPYLEDIFDGSVYDQWVTIETTRGCPFGCTFCDWGGATLSKVRKYSFDRVEKELEFLAQKKVERLFMADANFGMLTRDEDIADILVRTRINYGYPKILNVNSAKNATPRVAKIIENLYRHDIIDKAIISFQTLDQQTLNNVDRGNIKTSSYEELLRIFKSINIPVTTDLLIGLPGQSVETLAADVNYFFEYMVMPSVYYATVLTNAPMADPEYQKKYNIKLNSRGNVIATHSFAEDDWNKMIFFNISQIILIQEGFLKYIFYHLQIEYGIKAVDLVLRMTEISVDDHAQYQWIYEFMNRMINIKDDRMREFMLPQWKKEKSKLILDNLEMFYADFYRLVESEYGISVSESEKKSLIELQISLMKKPHRTLPDIRQVPHDVVRYFSQLQRYVSIREIDNSFKRLAEFPPSRVVTPKQFIKKFPYNYSRTPVRHLPEWPLVVEGLALQPSYHCYEDLPVHHKHMA